MSSTSSSNSSAISSLKEENIALKEEIAQLRSYIGELKEDKRCLREHIGDLKVALGQATKELKDYKIARIAEGVENDEDRELTNKSAKR
ncbi:hypothetical protein FA13DRAFT_1725460 [Coprinellus micaceus]|uniref:Uncharacterized protein n=1 Tax=Coprinellus micaceus TaxID=71717 RepID=A0A4Y7TV73_COPMI|nr:hypothetical protein FA13DRAFT_1725460 [Coprinellus micaceus]